VIAETARYAGAVLLLAGSLFSLIAALGVLRLPDLYTRLHAASKAGAVGGGMILLAVALVSFDGAVALRALIGIGFLLLTTPVAAHLLARAHHHSGGRPAQITLSNDLDIINKAARDN
jgi:multicomponent Na+:H+ antiporter subunit G